MDKMTNDKNNNKKKINSKKKNSKIINYNSEISIPQWLIDELDGDKLLARILVQRGVDTPEKVKRFLDPGHYQAAGPGDFPEMSETVQFILDAVESGSRICIYGDYDVDGVTSTVILIDLIKKIGGDVIYHLPDRFKEGYGMNKEVIKSISSKVDMIITCDCGISNLEEVALAKEMGLDVVVTDHHHLPDELPPADYILSPKMLCEDHPAYNIPGAGMAYYLAAVVFDKLDRSEEAEGFLDLLALAIVADVVPLLEENRYLLQIGLPKLKKTERIGLLELFNAAGITNVDNLTEEDIAFRIAPMINSAGRIKKADLAVELLLAEDKAEAKKYASQLLNLNKRRRELQDEVIEEAKEMMSDNQERKAVVLYRPYWHQGVVGIAAGRLCEDYQVPVLLMCLKDDEKTLTGSARSIPEIHIYDELKKCENYLSKFGGHAGAAGFSLHRDNLTGFRKNISNVLNESLENLNDTAKVIDVDGEFSLDEIEMQDYYDLRKLAPFGEQNPKPRFITKDTEIVYSRTTSGGEHLRLIAAKNGIQQSAIWWWAGEQEIKNKIDLIYSLDINEFRGKREIQLVVEDIIRETVQEEEKEEKKAGPEFEVIDCRNWKDSDQKLPIFKDAVYYYEGLKEVAEIANEKLINRYQTSEQKTLVLLTCPPSLEVFKEIIIASRPSKVVLAYSQSDLLSGKIFIKQLSGLIKHILKDKNGHFDLYQTAALTGQMESTIVVGLQYLEAKGFITVNKAAPKLFLIRYNQEEEKHESKLRLQELKALLSETRSFIRYMLKVEDEVVTGLFD